MPAPIARCWPIRCSPAISKRWLAPTPAIAPARRSAPSIARSTALERNAGTKVVTEWLAVQM